MKSFTPSKKVYLSSESDRLSTSPSSNGDSDNYQRGCFNQRHFTYTNQSSSQVSAGQQRYSSQLSYFQSPCFSGCTNNKFSSPPKSESSSGVEVTSIKGDRPSGKKQRLPKTFKTISRRYKTEICRNWELTGHCEFG